ncbi:MAG: hypothetical protein J6X30_03170 [Clostridia bacterium]|nr:hypothetical protein [Clostridia bacterium]
MNKRITLFCGHYGSGKTNIAVNYALALRKQYDRVAIADLDIVNPYFRTKDSSEDLAKAGIELICSPYAGSNVDFPALPQEIYQITDDKDLRVVIDVGGDDRGALALGRLAPAIWEERDFEMLAVVNRFRPLTPDAASAVEVLSEIRAASGLPFTGIVNNSNLGEETTAEDVLSSVRYAEEIENVTGLPLVMTCVKYDLLPALESKIDNLFPLVLQEKPTTFSAKTGNS